MRKLLFILIAMSVMTSCQKEDPTPSIESKNYMPLEVGNYWIYNHYQIDSEGNQTKLSTSDSVFISRDTSILGKQYFIIDIANNQSFKKKTYKILRDSMGYIVNEKGVIEFAQNNFIDKLNSYIEYFKEDTLYTLSNRMENPDYTVSVPAGTFEVLNRVENINIYKYSGEKKDIIRTYQNNFYAQNTGIILDTYRFLSTPDEFIERRLIRYHVYINENPINN